MSNRLRKYCRNCGTEFANYSDRQCGTCGRIRDDAVGAEVTGCLVTSYSVPMRDGTTVGPVPLATVVSMIKSGAISPDAPIFDMDSGRCFLADEDLQIRSQLGLIKPPSAESATPSASSAPAASYNAPQPAPVATPQAGALPQRVLPKLSTPWIVAIAIGFLAIGIGLGILSQRRDEPLPPVSGFETKIALPGQR